MAMSRESPAVIAAREGGVNDPDFYIRRRVERERKNGHALLRWAIFLVAATIILELATTQPAHAAPRRGTPAYRAAVVCIVFGPKHCSAAVQVARCESGFNTAARNGQYRGLFQVSAAWRRRFSRLWGSGAWAQARHARAVFVSGGYSWHPWECRPGRWT